MGLVGKARLCVPIETYADLPDLPDLPELSDAPDPPGFSRRDFLSAALLLPTLARQTSDARFDRDRAAGQSRRRFSTPVRPTARRRPRRAAVHRPVPSRLHVGGLAPTRFAPRPTDFFIRTAAPSNLPPADSWTLRVAGQVAAPVDLRLRDLESPSRPSRRALIECSGNADQTNYGLMSTADWEGIPLDVDPRSRQAVGGRVAAILISGVDDDTRRRGRRWPARAGFSPRDELQHAVLAVRMNGAPLTARSRLSRPPHRPRLVRLQLRQVGRSHRAGAGRSAGDDADAGVRGEDASTDHRARLRARSGRRTLARDFIPAVDRHRGDAGASREVDRRRPRRVPHHRDHLGRIDADQRAVDPLQDRASRGCRSTTARCRASTLTWSLWSHTWRPAAPGRYQIVLRVDDPEDPHATARSLLLRAGNRQIDDV